MVDQETNDKAIDGYMLALQREARVLDDGTRSELLIQVRQHFDETEAEGLDVQSSIKRLGQPADLVREAMGQDSPSTPRRSVIRVVWGILVAIGVIWILAGAGILIGSLAIGASQGWLLISAAMTLLLGVILTFVAARRLKRSV